MEKKCGYVVIAGRPNAGKSTLMNALLDFRLSAVSRKAQTTRNKIQGILTGRDYQIIFIDTPGMLEPQYELQKFMVREIRTSLTDADLIIYILDASTFDVIEFQKMEKLFEGELGRTKRIFVLNKIDIVSEENANATAEKIKSIHPSKEVIKVSAVKHINLDTLKNKIINELPAGDFLYDPEMLTEKPERFFVAEIIREKILELFEEEIPYSVFVDVREYKERKNAKDFINADIIIERESQKIIIIGKNGQKIKQLGESARAEIEKFLGRNVYMNLFVKVKKNWRKDPEFLRRNFN